MGSSMSVFAVNNLCRTKVRTLLTLSRFADGREQLSPLENCNLARAGFCMSGNWGLYIVLFAMGLNAAPEA